MGLLPGRNQLAQSPDFSLHREAVAAVDSSNPTDPALGVDARGFREAVVNVTFSWGISSCDLEVLFWNERAGAFVSASPAVTFASVTANKAVAFEAKGRRFFVKVTALTGGVAATGELNVVAAASIAAGGTDHFHIGDGAHAVQEVYYDKDGSRAPGANEWEVTLVGTEDANAVRDETAAVLVAMKAGGILSITETHVVAAKVALTNDAKGVAGNVPIVETVANAAYTATGMIGGTDLPKVWIDVAGHARQFEPT
jgi:hypothetical protein